jgi:hypothetical protein
MSYRFILIFLLHISLAGKAQPVHTQYNFAQSYIGLGMQYLPATGQTHYINVDGSIQSAQVPSLLQPRLRIGGLHFWGKADFSLSFPLYGWYAGRQSSELQSAYSTGVDVGARYYISRIRRNRISPFVGINWCAYSYIQKANGQDWGPLLDKQMYSLEAGACYTTKKAYLFDAVLQLLPVHDFSYAVSRTQFAGLSLPAISFQLGVKKPFDFTNYYSSSGMQKYHAALDKYMNAGRRGNSFSIAAGPSSALQISGSTYEKNNRSFLQNAFPVGLFPDLAFGYYMAKQDIEVRLSYRPITQSQYAYDFSQRISRHSLVLEGIKFFWNYKGFVPFAGAGVSAEWIYMLEKDSGRAVTNINTKQNALVLVAGWDIRPSKVEWLILRTNLRYSPDLHLNINSERLSLNQLEINFIQVVFYPQRLKTTLKFNKTYQWN